MYFYMIFSEYSTEQGKKCEIVIKGSTIDCVVLCAFELWNKNKLVYRKYRLEGNEKEIYDNINSSDIKFKK